MVELLVVILIIGILSGIVLTAMGGGDNSRSLDAANLQVRSLFSLAHSAAITRSGTTRVLIHADPDDERRFLKYFTIVYLSDDNDTPSNPNDDEWEPYTEGEFLPEGVYFSPGMSAGNGTSQFLYTTTFSFDPATLDFTSPEEMDEVTASKISATDSTDPASGKGTDQWFAYEFNPNGTLKNPIGRVILTTALLVGDDASKELVFPAGANPYQQARGFAIFRSGKLMFFQDAEQMEVN